MPDIQRRFQLSHEVRRRNLVHRTPQRTDHPRVPRHIRDVLELHLLAKRQTIDPDAFEPPSGYKRQEMFPGRYQPGMDSFGAFL